MGDDLECKVDLLLDTEDLREGDCEVDDECVWALDGTEDVALIAVTLSDVFWCNIKCKN